MSQFKTQLKAVEQEMGRYADEIEAIWAKAKDEERDVSADEALEVNTRTKALGTLKDKKAEIEDQIAVEDQVREVGKSIGRVGSDVVEFTQQAQVTPYQEKSIGQQFVESSAFKSIQEKYKAGSKFSAAADIGYETKGTLLTGAGAPGAGTGGGLLNAGPTIVPGSVNKLFQRLSLADLIPTGSTNTNTVRYVVEGTATSGAAGVAEAGDKPQSTLALSTVDEPVKKVATSLAVSDEMLEDASQVASYINGRLSLFVAIEEERQIARGAGTNEIFGFFGRTGSQAINIYAGGTVDDKAKQLFKALNGTRGSSFLEPDAIVLHPTDWQAIRLLRDTNGQYYGGGPFQGPYGSGQNVAASGQVTGAIDSLWGKPVIVTTGVGNAGTALIGAFSQAAQLFRRSGITVDMTNSHDDWFLKDLVAIRAEQRFALAVYRPAAFTSVLLQGTAGESN